MKVGIIGGIGPESTVDYYKSIITEYRKVKQDGSYPEIVIDSIDMTKMLNLVLGKKWDNLVNMLVQAIENVNKAGADFAVIASNTPHVVFEKVEALSPLPVLSIVEEACKKASELKLKKIGLFGTAFTMRESFYKDCFLRNGINIVIPSESEQELIHVKIFNELELGITKQETKTELIQIIDRMIKNDFIDGLILGCTELPLILNNGDCNIPFLNTIEIHVQGIIREFLKKD